MTFNDLHLNPNIEKAVEELGFQEPTPVQEQLIPHMLSSTEDVVALAQTGTGKTAAFGLPLVHTLDTDLKAVQALILCPTRELCLQITGDLKSFAKYMPGVGVAAVYGGANILTQKKEIREGAQIVAATPGWACTRASLADLIRLATGVPPRMTTIAPSETEIGMSGTAWTGSPPLMNGRLFSCSACNISLTPMNASSTASPRLR